MCLVNLIAVLVKIKLNSKFFPLVVLLLTLVCCNDGAKVAEEIDKIPVDFTVNRFDREFANATVQTIPNLKSKYPYLFSSKVPDSVWTNKLTDTLQLELEQEVALVFPEFEAERADLTSLVKHISYYFPGFKAPYVTTLISEVQYDARVVLVDSLLLIGLDNYLGPEHRFYAGLPNYVSKQLDKAYLTSDVASAFAKTVNNYPHNRSFLSRMLYYGKELYIKDLILPTTKDYQRINYTQDELEWALDNEEQIWRYIIEKELLYSTASDLDKRFLDPAPFSKFQLALDSESPGRIGRFVGWQIIRAFMANNPDITLVEVLDMPADEIFKKSNYKPKR